MAAFKKNSNCRLCLSKCEDATSIFTDNHENGLLELIFKYLLLKIEHNDVYSTNICQNCSKNLKDFHNFHQCVQKCQVTLQRMFESSKNTTANATIEQSWILKQESDQEFFKSTESEDCHVIYEINTAIEHDNEDQNMDPLSADIPDLTAEGTSQSEVSSEDEDYFEDSQATSDTNGGEEYTPSRKKSKKKKPLRRSNEEKNLTCSFCSKVYYSRDDLKCHIYYKHKEKDEGIERQTCPICSKVYTSFKNMRAHMKTYHPKKEEAVKDRTCPVCSRVYPTVKGMKCHIRCYHSARLDDIEDRTCPICLKVFSNIPTMRHHIWKDHDNAKAFSCSVCKKDFLTRPGFKAHTTNCFGTIAKNIHVSVDTTKNHIPEINQVEEKRANTTNVKREVVVSPEEHNAEEAADNIESGNQFTSHIKKEEYLSEIEIKQEDMNEFIDE